MMHPHKVTPEGKEPVSHLLALSEIELYAFWLTQVAVDFQSGRYLKNAPERSKKQLFSHWKKDLSNCTEAQ